MGIFITFRHNSCVFGVIKAQYDGFLSLVAAKYFNTRESVDSWTREAAFQLEDGKLEDFRTGLTSFLASIPYTNGWI